MFVTYLDDIVCRKKDLLLFLSKEHILYITSFLNLSGPDLSRRTHCF